MHVHPSPALRKYAAMTIPFISFAQRLNMPAFGFASPAYQSIAFGIPNPRDPGFSVDHLSGIPWNLEGSLCLSQIPTVCRCVLIGPLVSKGMQ